MKKIIAIEIKNLSKKYVVLHERPTIVENIISKKRNEVFWALKKINLTIKKGERVGIVGPNGSGKTTLLKIISGISTCSDGEIKVNGKVVSIIELEGGFHPELSGFENIKLSGLLLGMSKSYIEKNIDKIIKFADIGNFISAPLYTYSSGMKLRLGFAIAINSSPEILVLDENIAVGDAEFKEKSYGRIKQFFSGGKTVIIATHSFDVLKKICNRAIWLYNGKIRADGSVNKIISLYKKVYAKKIARLKRKNPHFKI